MHWRIDLVLEQTPVHDRDCVTYCGLSLPLDAFAQRGGRGGRGGGGGRVIVSRPVIVSPVFSPLYSYGRYDDPFFLDFYGWGFPSRRST